MIGRHQPAAFDAIASTLPFGSVGYEPQLHAKGERLIWVEAAVVFRRSKNLTRCDNSR
jgi:hypothetical protein